MEELKERAYVRTDVHLSNGDPIISFFSPSGFRAFVQEWRNHKYDSEFYSVRIKKYDMFSKSNEVIITEIDVKEIIAVESRTVDEDYLDRYNQRKDWY